MTRSQIVPTDFMEYPICPKCRIQMWQFVVEPDEPDQHRRTFQCPECEYEETVMLNYLRSERADP